VAEASGHVILSEAHGILARMRISIWPGAGQTYREVLEVALHAAQSGWDGVYVSDHFMSNPDSGRKADRPTLECGSLVAALGATVPKVRIGTLVYGNTYRHPAVLANMAATADHITEGRFTLGVGAGWQANEHEQYGIELPPVNQRLDRFEEALQVLRSLLKEPKSTFHGVYYQLEGAICEPKPIQNPLPILIGGGGERRMLRIVARYANSWNAWGTPSTIAHKSAKLDTYCAEIERNPTEIARTAQALTVLSGPVPEGLLRPVIGGSEGELADAVALYREAGLDELIVPDSLLGAGTGRLKAMDKILSIVCG
jgi:F420-dependent oxidoreductase-like protein